jgi:hypothetical protein
MNLILACMRSKYTIYVVFFDTVKRDCIPFYAIFPYCPHIIFFSFLYCFVLISSFLLFVFVPSLLITTSSFLCPFFVTFLYFYSSFSL